MGSPVPKACAKDSTLLAEPLRPLAHPLCSLERRLAPNWHIGDEMVLMRVSW